MTDVETLLQVLALLRDSERGVRRSTLVAKIPEYAAQPSEEALKKAVNRDRKRLKELGFVIDDTRTDQGESVFVLQPTAWHVPLRLDDGQRALLAWVMRAAGVASAAESHEALSGLPPTTYASVVGDMPPGLGLVHAALATQRQLIVYRHGEDQPLVPVQLASYEGRWYLLARPPGVEQVYGYRLDRLEVVALGEPLPVPPTRVDPLEVLDPTNWPKHEPVEVEVRCDEADSRVVASWFPRAEPVAEGAEAVLRFSARHTEAVLDRVLGLAGAARLCGPPELVEQLRHRLLPFAQVDA